MQAVVVALKARGLRPVMMPLAEDGKQVIAGWHPNRRGAPLALPAVAGAGRARRDRRGRASGDRPAILRRLPDAIDLGIVKIDLRARMVLVDGVPEVLPPKEFEILVQLALQPGAPLDSAELLGRVWPGSRSATVDDLHTRIWRLRRMIGDHRRTRPLITNRRGFGYVLNIAVRPLLWPHHECCWPGVPFLVAALRFRGRWGGSRSCGAGPGCSSWREGECWWRSACCW
jgi:DNA-binding winged helix-turn-helix (wHTH) protein